MPSLSAPAIAANLADEPYEPEPADWAEYAAWSRGLDAGCGERELTPDEMDLITHTATQEEFEDALADAAFSERYASAEGGAR